MTFFPIAPYWIVKDNTMSILNWSNIFISFFCLQKAIRMLFLTIKEDYNYLKDNKIIYWISIIFNIAKNLPLHYYGFTDQNFEMQEIRNWAEYFHISNGSWWFLPQVALINLLLSSIHKASTNVKINGFNKIDSLFLYFPVMFGVFSWLGWGIYVWITESNQYEMANISGISFRDLSYRFGEATNIKYYYWDSQDSFWDFSHELSHVINAVLGTALFWGFVYLMGFLIYLADGKIAKYKLDRLRKKFKRFGLIHIIACFLSLAYSSNFILKISINKKN